MDHMDQVTLYSADELRGLIIDGYGEDDAPQIQAMINRWLARGDGAAVYTNEDLGHRDAGEIQIVSYGSPEAQLEIPDPPTQLPDIGHRINWRYRLSGVYRGAEV